MSEKTPMTDGERICMWIVVFVGPASFGAWQRSFAAGLWFFALILTVAMFTDELNSGI